jgi:hypothetical protein
MRNNNEDEIVATENLLEIITDSQNLRNADMTEEEKMAGLVCRAAYLSFYIAHEKLGGIAPDTMKYIMFILNEVMGEAAIQRYTPGEAINMINEGQVALLCNKIDLLQTMKEMAHVECEDYYPETEFKLDVDRTILGLVEARLEAKGHHLNAYEVSNILEYVDTLEDKIARLESAVKK